MKLDRGVNIDPAFIQEDLVLLLFTIMTFWNEPLWIKPGDKVFDIPATTLEGETISLPDLISETTVCVFLSLNCPACQDAILPLESLSGSYEVFYLFVENRERVVKELPQSIDPSQALTINPEHLRRINAKTLPTLLAYRENRLVFGYYGPVDHDKLKLFRGAIEGTLVRP